MSIGGTMGFDHSAFGAQARPAPPSEFWGAYADGRVLWMKRVPGEWYDVMSSTHRQWPSAPSQLEHVISRITISWEALTSYDYRWDPRFSLGIYPRLHAAVRAVIEARIMRQETRPHRAQLGFVLILLDAPPPATDTPSYAELRDHVRGMLSERELQLDRALKLLAARRPRPEAYKKYQEDGDVAHLGMEREILLKAFGLYVTDDHVFDHLKDVVDNRKYEDAITIGVALWALGRQNNKRAIPYLLDVLRDPESGYHGPAAERALQFLCSGSELLQLSESHDRAAHWESILRTLPKSQDEWARRDARSVFWEKRLRCAVQWTLSGQYVEALGWLEADEVEQVRLAAQPGRTEVK